MLLGAFGGAMVPPEVFPEMMRTLSHVTPHAWAIDALASRRGRRLRTSSASAPQLAVLLAFAGVLLGPGDVPLPARRPRAEDNRLPPP